MRMMIVAAGCLALALSGCRSEEPTQPVAIEDPAPVETTGTVMSETITPGTTERAATATSTVAPTPATRTTTSAPPGTTVTNPTTGTQ